MNENVDVLLASYQRRGVLVDSNLLLLLLVGFVSKPLVPKFKRTQKYSVEDHRLLVGLLGQFEPVVTTPNVLTEVSNLANALKGKYRTAFGLAFSNYIDVLLEHYLASADLAHTGELGALGLTDTGIAKLCRNRFLLLTDDFKLAGYAASIGVDAVNFNHVRDLNRGVRGE